MKQINELSTMMRQHFNWNKVRMNGVSKVQINLRHNKIQNINQYESLFNKTISG
jgi:hypothetical protein